MKNNDEYIVNDLKKNKFKKFLKREKIFPFFVKKFFKVVYI